eukprot:365287-Chlamydomonas_euryale.AAC.10
MPHGVWGMEFCFCVVWATKCCHPDPAAAQHGNANAPGPMLPHFPGFPATGTAPPTPLRVPQTWH